MLCKSKLRCVLCVCVLCLCLCLCLFASLCLLLCACVFVISLAHSDLCGLCGCRGRAKRSNSNQQRWFYLHFTSPRIEPQAGSGLNRQS